MTLAAHHSEGEGEREGGAVGGEGVQLDNTLKAGYTITRYRPVSQAHMKQGWISRHASVGADWTLNTVSPAIN